MTDITHERVATVVGWNLSGLGHDVRAHGDQVLRRASVAMLAAVAISSTVAYRQHHQIDRLQQSVTTQAVTISEANAQLDRVTSAHATLLSATSVVPAQAHGAWSHRFTVTQYIPRSEAYGRFNDGFTATMVKADPAARIVAVDPTLIPYGSSVWIEGLGWFSAQDCGSAIKGHRLDVLAATAREAFAFGRQERFVIVLPAERGV